MNQQEFLDKLEIELKISKNSSHTRKNYIELNKHFFNFINKNPEQISEDDIKKYIAEKLENKSSTSIIVFLSALKYAYSSVLKKDITSGIKRPKREKTLPVVLSKEEIKLLINSLSNKKSKLMISLMYAVGLRVSELINLKINDLDLNEKIGIIKQGKGKKDRIFNIPEFLIKDLKEQMDFQRNSQKDYLFT